MIHPVIHPEPRQFKLATLLLLTLVAGALGAGAAYWLVKANPAVPVAVPVAAPATAASAKPEQARPAEIKIPAAYLAAAGILVEPVRSGAVDTEILAPGRVEALPGAEATVVARAAGAVTRVNRHLGDVVAVGDVLALVDSLDAATMSADRSAAVAKAGLARKIYARESSLFEQGVAPRQDMETAQAALAVADAEVQRAAAAAQAARVAGDGRSIAVISPIAGKITAQSIILGAYVQPQAELFRVAGSGSVRVDAAVTAADLPRIAPGDKATIRPGSGTPVEATVRAITPTVSGASQSATVILIPDGAAAKDGVAHTLVIGAGVQVHLYVKGKTGGLAVLTVPEDAVQNLDGRDVLFVRTAAGFRPQPVLAGLRSGGVAQILAGVNAGDQVATRNAFLVKADMIKAKVE